MNMDFRGLHFELIGDRIVLTNCMNFAKCKDEQNKKYYNFVEVQIAGKNHAVHGGAKLFQSSEWEKLKYVSYSETENLLEIVQIIENVSVSTSFRAYDDCKTIKVWNVATNAV